MAYKGKYAGPDKYKGRAPKGGKWKGKYIGKDSSFGLSRSLKEIGQDLKNNNVNERKKFTTPVIRDLPKGYPAKPSDGKVSADPVDSSKPTEPKDEVAKTLTELKDSPEMTYKGKYAGPDKYKGRAPKGGKWKGKYIGKDEYKGTNAPKGAPRIGAYYGGWTDEKGIRHSGNEPGKSYAL